MYIGKIGDGSHPNDAVYTILKEVIIKSIEEARLSYGNQIDISIETNGRVRVRDYGRGFPPAFMESAVCVYIKPDPFIGEIPHSIAKLRCVSIAAGLEYTITNALSKDFKFCSYINGECTWIHCKKGVVVDRGHEVSHQRNGTEIMYIPDDSIYGIQQFNKEYVVDILKEFAYTNRGLCLTLNGERFYAKNGLLDELYEIGKDIETYTPIHLIGEDIEVAMAHAKCKAHIIKSYVNGHRTVRGGAHHTVFLEAVENAFKNNKEGESYIGIININISNPQFVSNIKDELCNKNIAGKNSPSIRQTIMEFIKENISTE